MKKNIIFSIILLSVIIFSGCNPQSPGGNVKKEYGDYSIKIIDSCEYIEYDAGIFDQRVYSLTHKGNCKFCELRK